MTNKDTEVATADPPVQNFTMNTLTLPKSLYSIAFPLQDSKLFTPRASPNPPHLPHNNVHNNLGIPNQHPSHSVHDRNGTNHSLSNHSSPSMGRLNAVPCLFTVADLLKAKLPKAREYALPIMIEETEKLINVIELLSNTNSSHAVIKNQRGLLIGTLTIHDMVIFCCNSFQKWNISSYEFVYRCKQELEATTVRHLLFLQNNHNENNQNNTGGQIGHSNNNNSVLHLSPVVQLNGSRLSSPSITRMKQNSISILAPIDDVLKSFSRPKVSSLVVLGDDLQEALGVITRSDVIDFIVHHSKELHFDLQNKKVKHCRMSKQTSSVEMNKIEFAIEAFEYLWSKQHNGMLVCHGKTIMDKFLNIIVQIMIVESEEADYSNNELLSMVYPDDSLSKVFEMIGSRSHLGSVYINDRTSKRISGEISMNDLIAQVLIPTPMMSN